MTRKRSLNFGPSVKKSFKVNRLTATHSLWTLSALPSLRGPEQPHQTALSLSLVAKLCLTLVIPWTVACQAPLSMEFSRQEYWSGLLFPSPGDLPDPGIEPRSAALQADSFTIWATREAQEGKSHFHLFHFPTLATLLRACGILSSPGIKPAPTTVETQSPSNVYLMTTCNCIFLGTQIRLEVDSHPRHLRKSTAVLTSKFPHCETLNSAHWTFSEPQPCQTGLQTQRTGRWYSVVL